MRYLVIANAGAGSSSGMEGAAGILDAGGGCEVVWTEGAHDVDRAVLSRREATLVVAGGDGSIHLVVNRLAALGRLDRPVGILPMGTGNDLARGLQLPLDPEEAARHLVSGTPTPLPLLAAPGGEVAVNNAHAGLGVAAARRGAHWKDRLGSLAYTAGSVAEGVGYDGFSADVTVDGEALHRGRCLALMVLVGPSAGGGFRPVEDVGIAQPILDVLVIGVGETPGRAGLLTAALRGRLDASDDVMRRRGRRVEVMLDGQEWELDGEFRTWPDPVELALDARTWTVLASVDLRSSLDVAVPTNPGF